MTNKQSTNAHNPQIEHSGPRRINWFLVWLILAPFALLIGRELSRGGLIGYFRVADARDLLLLSPLSAIILIYMLF